MIFVGGSLLTTPVINNGGLIMNWSDFVVTFQNTSIDSKKAVNEIIILTITLSAADAK